MIKARNLLFIILIFMFLNSNSLFAQKRIINGTAATVQEYPFIVNLFVMSDPNTGMGGSCGGSLIAPQWILTAGHCFLNEQSEVDTSFAANTWVTINSTTLEPMEDAGIQAYGESVIIHPNYNPQSNDNDIALLKLSAPVEGASSISLIQGSMDDITAGTMATIMGWGTTRIDVNGESADASNSLLKVDQMVVSNSECNSVYGEGITDNMLCAGGLTATDTRDSCQGDSGGPLVTKTAGGFVQIGITSFGGVNSACGEAGVPGVYAKVARYQDFISSHVAEVSFATLDGSVSTSNTSSSQDNSSSQTDSTTNNSSDNPDSQVNNTDNGGGTSGAAVIDNTNESSASLEQCGGAQLDNELNIAIPCLTLDGVAYQTRLIYLGDNWAWSEELSLSSCSMNTSSCTSVDNALNLTIRQVDIGGTKYQAELNFLGIDDFGGLYWGYSNHYPQP